MGVDIEIGSTAPFAPLDGRTLVFPRYDDLDRAELYEIDAPARPSNTALSRHSRGGQSRLDNSSDS